MECHKAMLVSMEYYIVICECLINETKIAEITRMSIRESLPDSVLCSVLMSSVTLMAQCKCYEAVGLQTLK